MSSYIIPVLIGALLLYCAYKRIGIYDCFVEGAKEALKLTCTIFPYIAAIFVLISLFRASGFSEYTAKLLQKPLSWVGIPPALAELILLRPVSGNGSLALLEQIFEAYGGNSYEAKCAAIIMGSSETILYVSAVYFSATKIKKLRGAIPIALVASFVGALVSCVLCRFI